MGVYGFIFPMEFLVGLAAGAFFSTRRLLPPVLFGLVVGLCSGYFIGVWAFGAALLAAVLFRVCQVSSM